MGDWRETTLGNMCKNMFSGGTPNTSQHNYYLEGVIPWLNTKEVNNSRIYFTEKLISNLGLENSSAKWVPANNVIVAMYGATAGKVAVNKIDLTTNQACCNLVVDESIASYEFIFYYLKNNYERLVSLSNGAAQQNLNTGIIKSFKVLAPDIQTQEKIASILSSLDDKIELNRKMNETLEEMARAIFKSWFVDFDPVHAKARGEKPAGMPDEIADLFPSEFVHSNQLNKLIPKGWEVKPISCLANLNSKSWTNKNAPQKVRYLDLANTKNGEISLIIEYLFPEAPSRARRVLSIGDTIIGTVRPGNRSFAYISDDGLTGSTGFAVMTPKQFAFKEFVFLALTEDSSIDYFAHLADGAAYPAVRPEVVANIEFVIPPENIVKAFSITTADLLVKIGLNRKQNIELSVIRDSLLPKLISGEIEV